MGQGAPVTLRRRATAVVIREDKVLLVHERGIEGFHMPGGGIEVGELPAHAVGRELREETGLTATTASTYSTTVAQSPVVASSTTTASSESRPMAKSRSAKR